MVASWLVLGGTVAPDQTRWRLVHLAALGVVGQAQARILLDQLGERAGQPHVVLVVLGRQGHGEQRPALSRRGGGEVTLFTATATQTIGSE